LFYLTVTICINLTHSCLYSSMSKFCDLQDWKSPVEYRQW
jgi:hypothetical protein